MPLRRTIPRVLCVGCSSAIFEDLRESSGPSRMRFLAAVTRDEAVALCVAEIISLAVVDGISIRGREFSLAQSLKLVRPSLPVVLLEERKRISTVPDCIDAVVPVEGLPGELLSTIHRLLRATLAGYDSIAI